MQSAHRTYEHPPLPPPEDVRQSLTLLYDVIDVDVNVGGVLFRLLKVHNTNELVDRITPEEFAIDERLPYWAELWASSLDLARYFLKYKDSQGKKILEVGCGLGLAGIAAASAGGRVTMTDYDEHALMFARYNAMRNLSHAYESISFRLLDWRDPEPAGNFDCIIAADVVYERRNFDPLLKLFMEALKPGGRVIMTEPSRSTGRDFTCAARSEGFEVNETTHVVNLNGRESTIVLSELRR